MQAAMEKELASITLEDLKRDTEKYLQQEWGINKNSKSSRLDGVVFEMSWTFFGNWVVTIDITTEKWYSSNVTNEVTTKWLADHERSV